MTVRLLLAGVTAAWAGFSAPVPPTGETVQDSARESVVPASEREAAIELQRLANQSLTFPAERQVYAEASRAAWRYVERHTQSKTGLIDATPGYPFTTIWDIGSSIGALYAGHELSLVDTADYDRRMWALLGTLAAVDLFDGAAFNKLYSTQTGSMVERDDRLSKRGTGWSAIDLGRLLVWLKILAVNQPRFADAATAVVGRLAMDRLIKHGYLRGEALDSSGTIQRYQEGQIGYEQYAARGFEAWGFPPSRALSWDENAMKITVMGHQLVADFRARDRLTSDPLYLVGLELGWDHQSQYLSHQLLAAQEARHRKTGRLTLIGEDAMREPPFYFYYYSAWTHGKEFALDVQDPKAAIEEPRWVSAKAAFAWHALMPSAYTELALQRVGPAREPEWAAGVYEVSGKSTGSPSINTAGVILTAALVHTRGEPVLKAQGPGPR